MASRLSSSKCPTRQRTGTSPLPLTFVPISLTRSIPSRKTDEVPRLLFSRDIQKACDAFEKESSLKPAYVWLHTYAPKIRNRLSALIPMIKLTDKDVLGMQMLCGYETIARGTSPFCPLFTDGVLSSFFAPASLPGFRGR
jgi:hypothetical protein